MAAVSYPLLEEPLPPHLVTLDTYAGEIRRTAHYIRSYWMPRDGFPAPVGELRGGGRNGGGRRPKVYERADLMQFRNSQEDLHGQGKGQLVTTLDLDAEVTLGRFADSSSWEDGGKPDRKTIAQHQGRAGFPAAGDTNRYRVRDLLAYFNSRSGGRGPARNSPGPPRRARAGSSAGRPGSAEG